MVVNKSKYLLVNGWMKSNACSKCCERNQPGRMDHWIEITPNER